MPTLQVTVVSGKDLAVRDRDTSDPYVKLRVGYAQQWHKTRVQKNNLNPVFNENFKLHVDSPDEQNLDIEVWDSDLISRGIPW
jgi:Ca2+-dependent lipid-binding protein